MKRTAGRQFYVVTRPLQRARVVQARGKAPYNDPQRESPVFRYKRACRLWRVLDEMAYDVDAPWPGTEEERSSLRAGLRWPGIGPYLDHLVSGQGAQAVSQAQRVAARLGEQTDVWTIVRTMVQDKARALTLA